MQDFNSNNVYNNEIYKSRCAGPRNSKILRSFDDNSVVDQLFAQRELRRLETTNQEVVAWMDGVDKRLDRCRVLPADGIFVTINENIARLYAVIVTSAATDETL